MQRGLNLGHWGSPDPKTKDTLDSGQGLPKHHHSSDISIEIAGDDATVLNICVAPVGCLTLVRGKQTSSAIIYGNKRISLSRTICASMQIILEINRVYPMIIPEEQISLLFSNIQNFYPDKKPRRTTVADKRKVPHQTRTCLWKHGSIKITHPQKFFILTQNHRLNTKGQLRRECDRSTRAPFFDCATSNTSCRIEVLSTPIISLHIKPYA